MYQFRTGCEALRSLTENLVWAALVPTGTMTVGSYMICARFVQKMIKALIVNLDMTSNHIGGSTLAAVAESYLGILIDVSVKISKNCLCKSEILP
jgi:hypothetical protein